MELKHVNAHENPDQDRQHQRKIECIGDYIEKFSEFDAAKGSLGRIRGSDIMNILMDLMNYAHKFGA